VLKELGSVANTSKFHKIFSRMLEHSNENVTALQAECDHCTICCLVKEKTKFGPHRPYKESKEIKKG